MTIDEAKRLLNNHLDGVTNYCEREHTDKAIQVAIETMRKYQKNSLNMVNTTMPQSFPCITKDEINKTPTVEAIPKDQYEALKQHLFELSYSIDSHSSSKDYAALRNTHYENQNWIKENGLQDEYYNYFFKQIKEIKDALC